MSKTEKDDVTTTDEPAVLPPDGLAVLLQNRKPALLDVKQRGNCRA